MSSIASRNSKAAQEYAAKRKSASEQAQARRLKDNTTPYQNSDLQVSGSNMPNVEIQSYGDFCERIIVRPPSNSKHDYDNPKLTNSASTQASAFTSGQGFLSPPQNPGGTLYDVSDRPILCSSSQNDEVILGSTDHALYSIKLSNKNESKIFNQRGFQPSSSRSNYTQMYSKTMGHTDWVTTVCHLADSRVLSGGMDSRVLLWSLDRRSCVELQSHDMSISKIISLYPLNKAVSVSYDKRGAVWNFGDYAGGSNGSSNSSISRSSVNKGSLTKQRPVDYLLGHSEPIIDCTVLSCGSNMYAVSGDRFGEMKVFDLSNCETVTTISRKMANNGHLTTLCSLDNMNSFVYGGTDGRVRVCDIRQGNSVACTIAAHIERAETRGMESSSLSSVTSGVAAMSMNSSSDKESSTPRRSLKPSRLSAHSAAGRSPNTASASASSQGDAHNSGIVTTIIG